MRFAVIGRSRVLFGSVLAGSMLFLAGCQMPAMPIDIAALNPLREEGVTVRVESVPVKIALAAGSAALQVASEEYFGMRFDVFDLLARVANVDVQVGIPPTDEPVLMVVNKETNDVLYWRLTEDVASIRLRNIEPGDVELKVVNESPLRVELWVDGELDTIDAVIDFNN
jgi:hypothetical protein